MTTPKKTTKAAKGKDPKAAAPAKGAKDAKKAAAKPKTFDTKAKGVKPLETFLKSIPVKLSAKEKDQRVIDHNKVWREIGALEMKKKVFTENLNAELKEKNAEFDRLMSAMESGSEDMEIRHGLFPVFSKNIVYTVRLDTGEIVGERTMTPDEKLKLTPKGKPGNVVKLGLVKDENQVKADAEAKAKKDGAPAPATADGGMPKEPTEEEKRKKEADDAWTDKD